MRAFQYKALHNIHFLNEKLFLFIKLTHLYLSFFVKEDKTVAHFFFLSISQSILLLFLMLLLLPVYRYILSSGHGESISKHFFLFLSITVISGLLCSNVLSVCLEKLNKILQSPDSKTFSGLCMYHLSALLNLHFSHRFQWGILATLSFLTCWYFFPTSFNHSEKMYATVSSAIPDGLNVFFLRPHFLYSLCIGPGLVLLQWCFQFLSLSRRS